MTAVWSDVNRLDVEESKIELQLFHGVHDVQGSPGCAHSNFEWKLGISDKVMPMLLAKKSVVNEMNRCPKISLI